MVTFRAGRSCGGGREGSSKTLISGRSGGGGRDCSQTHSEPGGVVEGSRRASKRTQSQEEWWSRPGGQPNAL